MGGTSAGRDAAGITSAEPGDLIRSGLKRLADWIPEGGSLPEILGKPYRLAELTAANALPV